MLTLHAQSRHKYDLTELILKAGARIALELINDDDMLHNLVITEPGQGALVGAAALNLGLEGDAKSHVPDLPAANLRVKRAWRNLGRGIPGSITRLPPPPAGPLGRVHPGCNPDPAPSGV